MSHARRDWIVVNSNTQRMECLRCHATEPLKMPALVKAFVLRLEAFEEEHKDCKPPAPLESCSAPMRPRNDLGSDPEEAR